MNILINYDSDSVVANISGDSQLVEISFAMESVLSHFFGRGVHRFDCQRSREQNGSCVLRFKALNKSKAMLFSKVASIRTLANQGYIPQSLKPSERFQNEENGFEKYIVPGQHVHHAYLIKNNQELKTSIIDQDNIKQDHPLIMLMYGLSDLFTGLFALDVKYFKWQGSVEKTQLYFKHNLTDQEIAAFINSKVDYDIKRKVHDLN